ncbi:DUF6448 family protein [Streptomyces sp. NPDC006430]|uniref:DUF6448 family protein n=1 Tax=Streptomyces sp. NPDC006430 TaxID=3154299 RepID=UPI00339E0B9E
MPPHCDSLDGPAVTATRLALQEVSHVLPYVPQEGEQEVREAFGLADQARSLGPTAREVADRWFFETVVRVHRAGEGAPFTGLKPAGLDVGPVISAAERALDDGSADELATLLCAIAREQVEACTHTPWHSKNMLATVWPPPASTSRRRLACKYEPTASMRRPSQPRMPMPRAQAEGLMATATG